MAELTPQDRERYQKLYNAAKELSNIIPGENDETSPGGSGTQNNGMSTLKKLTIAFSDKLHQPEALSSFDELLSQVELTGGYLAMYPFFADRITDVEINKVSLKLRTYYNQIKVSLTAVDDDFLDNLTVACSDPLFLKLLTDSEVKEWTKKLLSDHAPTPTLESAEVEKLINAWGTAVTGFVEDARKQGDVDPGEPETIAHFFCIHDQLEGLYSELSKAVALNS